MGKEPKIDPDLLAQAEQAGVAVDQVIDEALRRALHRADKAGAEARAAQWAEENAEAIEDYNRRIRERGVFSAGFRTW
ncbi:type II toxin-antitoxin system CcdA family antitoxin [Phenylobacterium sp.]|uniref:type II toxin-antitoxin system CcdA family antitoxin n=1 Tax=Phenylobacterium sp. TaxID=1871053 RepID=UPI002DE7F4A9|nr:type II toxin-antitoxin system CcdA family antitoxin [Phenylobacterium sp.]